MDDSEFFLLANDIACTSYEFHKLQSFRSLYKLRAYLHLGDEVIQADIFVLSLKDFNFLYCKIYVLVAKCI